MNPHQSIKIIEKDIYLPQNPKEFRFISLMKMLRVSEQ